MKKLSVGIVVSDFNQEITNELKKGCLEELARQGIAEDQIAVFHVPGAIEIPFVLQRLAKTQKYAALIALGAVIRGETTHYDYVCEQVSQGCARIMLDYDLPVVFGILTTENDEQAIDRIGGRHGHKGIEAAQVALQMIAVGQSIYSS